ncbi:MAG TPA: hypothetical protein PLW78_03550 [bacterium]|nr:hypothetical protein [bacterium]
MKKNEKKRALYQELFEDMDLALKDKYYLESAWYSYAIIEDRARSILEKTGLSFKKKKGDAKIVMLGKKLSEIENRTKKNDSIATALAGSPILIVRTRDWCNNSRNPMMHGLAGDFSLSTPFKQLRNEMKKMAEEGKKLSREWSSMVNRFKSIQKKNEKTELIKKNK